MFGWILRRKPSPTEPDLNAVFDAYLDHWQGSRRHPTEIVDEALLPFPKELIANALCATLATGRASLVDQETMTSMLLDLASYQPGVGPLPLQAHGIDWRGAQARASRAGDLSDVEFLALLSSDEAMAARHSALKAAVIAEVERLAAKAKVALAVARIRREGGTSDPTMSR